MAWQERISNNKFKVITGDGKEYFPLWKLEGLATAFNLTENEYPGVKGTFVDRRLIKGKTRNLNVTFQGSNAHITASEFLISAENTGSWKVEHPLDGTLIVQPLSMSVNRTVNTAEFIIAVRETISEIGIEPVDTALETINQNVLNQNAANVANYAQQNVSPEQISQGADFVTNLDDNFNNIITDAEEASEFENLIKQADKLSQSILSDTEAAVEALNDITYFVGRATVSVTNRVNAIINTTGILLEKINIGSTIESKTYAAFGSMSNTTSAALMAATPQENNYQTRTQVNNISESITALYNSVVEKFDGIAGSGRVGAEQFELPELPLRLCRETVLSCLGKLDEIAFNSAQEITIITDQKYDIITLANKLYNGLGEDDENIERLIEVNNLGPNQILQIEKGTEITYLV